MPTTDSAVLIAASDAALRRNLAAPLADAGYRIMEVERGAAACAALEAAEGPRIALLALDMPDFGGLEVCQRLGRRDSSAGHRYLIVVPGQDAARDAAAAFSAGAEDVLYMPAADETLRAQVARARIILEQQDDRACAHAYLQAVLAGTSDGVLLTDGAGRIALANDALGHILGAELGGVVARPRAEFLIQQADHIEPRATWLQTLREGLPPGSAPLEFEVAAMPAPRVVRWASRPIALPEGGGHLDLFRDVTLELEVQQERELMALVDPVTGLYNRRGAEDTIARELARVRRNGTKLSIALFAIVGLDRGLDTGQAPDDEVLRRIGDVLSLTARMTDITVRWSPDELLVVLPETALDSAAVFAERVRASFRAGDLNRAPAVALSIGTAEYAASEPDLDAAVERAHRALRAVKE